jgi:Flp pilus assembly protein TadD
MPPSLVEKYEIILAADPKSRVFVELARALVDHGNHARAIDVCRQGIEHHPASIQGRVIWAKALLAAGDVDEAVVQFDLAAGIEPRNPYAYNLAAELLAEKGLLARALPLLEQAAELQPGNEKIRAWLADARKQAGAAAPATPREATPAPEPGKAGTPPRLARKSAAPAAPPARPPVPSTTPTGTAPPPLRKPPPPRPKREVTNPRFALEHLPESKAPEPAPSPAAAAGPDAREAARIAGEYERELRKKLQAPDAPQGYLRRNWLPLLAAALIALGLGGGGFIYVTVRRNNRAAEVRSYVESARKGIARDTAGALREAAKVLAEARSLDPANVEAASLSAEVAAVLWSDHGEVAARELAQKLAASGKAGDGALAARYLLAATPAARGAPAAELASRTIRVDPLVQTLVARVLLSRGETQSALSRLDIAARSSPPSLRALADLGDVYRERGDLEQALGYYRTALAAHATHPRSAIGAAEVRLALGRETAEALATLRAVEADPGSTPPIADRLRFELAYARALAAQGQRALAAERLDRANEKLGTRAELPAALAEIHMQAGAFDKAETEARRAVRFAPRESAWHVLLARAQNGRGRYRELLKDSEGADGREIRLYRGIARYELGDYRGARAELERSRRDGKMPAEAAAYVALCEYGLGREAQARALLEKLAGLEKPPAIAFVALGHLAAARGRADEAERDWRLAVEEDPSSVEAHCALGRLLARNGRAKEARASLEKAVALNPFHAEARLALGTALLAAGEAKAARDAFGAVLSEDPRSGAALRGLAAAHLADGHLPEARGAAERATSAEPKNPESWLAAARAALAQGDGAAVRRFAERAQKLAPKAASAVEARKLADRSKR